jgi:hypothetical protein
MECDHLGGVGFELRLCPMTLPARPSTPSAATTHMSTTDETIRRAVEVFGPELTEVLAKHRPILEGVANGDIPVVRKARKRHDVRGEDGVYQPNVITTEHNGLPITHSGAVHEFFRRAYAGQRRGS